MGIFNKYTPTSLEDMEEEFDVVRTGTKDFESDQLTESYSEKVACQEAMAEISESDVIKIKK